jgi:enamine deaminase RidA (YjgF/YER057c/UK114 family)
VRSQAPIPINPESLGAPRGYSHGMLAPAGGRLLAVAGQIAWDRDGRLVAEGFPGQFAQALANVLEVVRAAGGGPEHVLRLTIYVTDRRKYLDALPAVGDAYRSLMGRRYPAMALVEVAGLLEPGALVEIEGTAVVP